MPSILNFIKTNIYLISSIGIMALLAWNIFLQLRLEKTRKRIKIFYQGRKTKDLEEVIAQQVKKIKNTEKDIDKLLKWNHKLQKTLDVSIQKVGVIRFNPFKDIGGNQSFVIALLDSKDNGFVISSLYSKEGTRIYTKPIQGASSTHNLSNEEQQAIKQAV